MIYYPTNLEEHCSDKDMIMRAKMIISMMRSEVMEEEVVKLLARQLKTEWSKGYYIGTKEVAMIPDDQLKLYKKLAV